MSEYVLGVKILESGCRKVQIVPHLGDLNWVKGTYPTPYGVIHISHEVVEGKVVTKVSGPDEIEIIN